MMVNMTTTDSGLSGYYNITDVIHFDNNSDKILTDEEILLFKLGPRRREWPVVALLLSIYCLIFVTGLLGNIFTCIVIIKTSYMRTSTNYYLFSLAISDVLLLVIGLPPEAYSIWESYPWRFGKAFCIIKALFAEMTSYASVLTITAFTIERYIAICKPLVSHKMIAFSRCIKIIIAIWIISLFCALPYPIHTDLFMYVSDDQGNPIPDSLQCNIPPKFYNRMKHVLQLSLCVFFVIPLTLIIVLYSLIGIALRKADLRRETSDKICHGSGRNQSQEGRKSPTCLAMRSVLKVLVAVVVAFFVCWAPFHAQRLLTAYNTNWTPVMLDLQSSLFYISGVLYFIGSTVNPILYNVMSRRYRLAFLEAICGNRQPHHYHQYSPRMTNGHRSTILTMKDACPIHHHHNNVGQIKSNVPRGNHSRNQYFFNEHDGSPSEYRHFLKHNGIHTGHRNRSCSCNSRCSLPISPPVVGSCIYKGSHESVDKAPRRGDQQCHLGQSILKNKNAQENTNGTVLIKYKSEGCPDDCNGAAPSQAKKDFV